LLGSLVGDRLFELVGEAGERGPVGRRVRLRGELCCEVGSSFAKRFEAVAVLADAVLDEVGCELAVFECLEVAFELLLDAGDLGPRWGVPQWLSSGAHT
jgi:hypothetical protein